MMKVLLIDDEEPILDVFRLALEFEGHQVSTARDGKQALALLERSAADSAPLPDVLLLDLMMPEMDGWEFLSAFRSNPRFGERFKKIPVIVISAFVDRPQPAGTVAFLKKPVDLGDLSETLGKIRAA